jgi:hypothetical protein
MATETTFVKELKSLINRHSMENGSNTPDFLLAAFMGDVLSALDDLVRARDSWYGVDLRPGQSTGREPKQSAVKLVAQNGVNSGVLFNGMRFTGRYLNGAVCTVVSFNETTNILSVDIVNRAGNKWHEDGWALKETIWGFERGDYWPIANEDEQQEKQGQTTGQINTLNHINRKTPDGRLLFAALAKLTTESQKDKTPDQVIKQLNQFANAMDKSEEQHWADWDKTVHEMKLAELRRSTPNVR